MGYVVVVSSMLSEAFKSILIYGAPPLQNIHMETRGMSNQFRIMLVVEPYFLRTPLALLQFQSPHSSFSVVILIFCCLIFILLSINTIKNFNTLLLAWKKDNFHVQLGEQKKREA